MSEKNEWKKSQLNEEELEQAAGGDAHVERTMLFRFRCPNCGNIRTFSNTIGSLVCDCGTYMVPVPLD